MRKKYGAVIVLILIFIFLFFISIKASVTGKISGRVTDAETGEPHIGANIIIEHTLKGAATDKDGEYYIINVQEEMFIF